MWCALYCRYRFRVCFNRVRVHRVQRVQRVQKVEPSDETGSKRMTDKLPINCFRFLAAATIVLCSISFAAVASDESGPVQKKQASPTGRFRFPNPPHHYPPILLKPFSQKTHERPYAVPFAKDASGKQEETFAVPQYFGPQPQPYSPQAVTMPTVGSGYAPGIRQTGGYPFARGFAGAPMTPGVANVQFGPSKASGNYYSPSTQDSTASGSYYANDKPSITPMLKLNKGRNEYWGPSGNPFPKNLNDVPW